ncbi:MAG: cytosine permease [Clostridia bacterium]
MNENQKNIETDALRPIKMEERMSWQSMAFVQAGMCVCVPAFLLGSILAECMSLWSAIISGTLGYLIVVIITSLLGYLGSDLGVATCTTCLSGMGVKGSRYIVSTVLAVNLIGWFGINNVVCGEAFSNVLYSMFGISLPLTISSLLWGAIMLSTAVFGMSAIEKLDKISIPLLMIIMVVGTYLVIKQFGIANINAEVEQTMSFAAGVGLSFNFYAIGAIAPADFTRFQKTRTDVWKSTFWGVFPMGIVTLVLGIIMTKLANNYDISMVLIDVGIPVVGITSMILSTWTTNAANAYTGALDAVMIFNFPDNKRREMTLIVGGIGTILGAFNILSSIESVLSMLACIACPIGGVMLADYFIVGKGKPENWHPVKGYNWAGVIAWALGSIISYYLYLEYLGIIIGMVIYLVLEKFMPSPSRGNGVAKEKIDTSLEEIVIKS